MSILGASEVKELASQDTCGILTRIKFGWTSLLQPGSKLHAWFFE